VLADHRFTDRHRPKSSVSNPATHDWFAGREQENVISWANTWPAPDAEPHLPFTKPASALS
jgi:hypothetical protein